MTKAKTTVVVEYEIEESKPGDAAYVVGKLLDNGEPQDAINGHAMDAGPLQVTKAFVRLSAVLLAAGLVLASGAARAADAVPFFRPDAAVAAPSPAPAVYGPKLPDPIATDCALDDAACISDHEGRVLAMAIDSRDRTWCANASDAPRCEALYDFVVEGAPAPAPDPVLADPCTYVVKVDAGKATLYSRDHRTKVVDNQGWRAARFIGACDLSSLEQHVEDGVQTLRAFPWVGATAKR